MNRRDTDRTDKQRRMRRWTWLFIALALIITGTFTGAGDLLPYIGAQEVRAAIKDPTAFGVNNNLTWEITDDGELIIQPGPGKTDGKLPNGNSGWVNPQEPTTLATKWPWQDPQYRDQITKLTINYKVRSDQQLRYAFYGLTNLKEANLSGLVANGDSNVLADAACDMFRDCTSLETVTFANTFNPKQYNRMFQGCTNLKKVTFGTESAPFNPDRLTNTSSMFESAGQASGAIELYMPGITLNANKHGAIFAVFGYTSMPVETTLNLTGATVPQNQTAEFRNNANGNIDHIILDGATLSGTDFSQMFANMYNLKSVSMAGDVEASSVTNMNKMFYNCPNLESIDISGFDKLDKIIDMGDFVKDDSALKYLNMDNLDNSNIQPTLKDHTANHHCELGLETCTSLETLSAKNSTVWMRTDDGGTPAGHQNWDVSSDQYVLYFTQNQMIFNSDAGPTENIASKRDYVDLISDRTETGARANGSNENSTNINTKDGHLNTNGAGYLAPGVYNILGKGWDEPTVDMAPTYYRITDIDNSTPTITLSDTTGILSHNASTGRVETVTKTVTDWNTLASGNAVVVKNTDDSPLITLTYPGAATDINGNARDIEVTINKITFKDINKIPDKPNRLHETNPYVNVEGENKYKRLVLDYGLGKLVFRNYVRRDSGDWVISGGSGTDIDFDIKVKDAKDNTSILFYMEDLDIPYSQTWIPGKDPDTGADDWCYDTLPFDDAYVKYGAGSESIVLGAGNDLATLGFADHSGLEIINGNNVVPTGPDPDTAWSAFSVRADAQGSSYTWTSGVGCDTYLLKQTPPSTYKDTVYLFPEATKTVNNVTPTGSFVNAFDFKIEPAREFVTGNKALSDDPVQGGSVKNHGGNVRFDELQFKSPSGAASDTYYFKITETSTATEGDVLTYNTGNAIYFLKVEVSNPADDLELERGVKAVATVGRYYYDPDDPDAAVNTNEIIWDTSGAQTLWAADAQPVSGIKGPGGETVFEDGNGTRFYRAEGNFYAYPADTETERVTHRQEDRKVDYNGAEYTVYQDANGVAYFKVESTEAGVTTTQYLDPDTHKVLMKTKTGDVYPADSDKALSEKQTVDVGGTGYPVQVDVHGKKYVKAGDAYYGTDGETAIEVEDGVFNPDTGDRYVYQDWEIELDGTRLPVKEDVFGAKYVNKKDTSGNLYNPDTGNYDLSEGTLGDVLPNASSDSTVTRDEQSDQTLYVNGYPVYETKNATTGIRYYYNNGYYSVLGTVLTPGSSGFNPNYEGDTSRYDSGKDKDTAVKVASDIMVADDGTEFYRSDGSYYDTSGTAFTFPAGKLDTNDAVVVGGFANKVKTSEIVIEKKTVGSKAGKFSFTISFDSGFRPTNYEFEPAAQLISESGSAPVQFVPAGANTYKFTLSEGQKVTIKDVPLQTTYTVTEPVEANGWELISVDGDTSAVSASNTITEERYPDGDTTAAQNPKWNYSHVFTNRFTELSLNKVRLGGDSADSFEFSATAHISGLRPLSQFSYGYMDEENKQVFFTAATDAKGKATVEYEPFKLKGQDDKDGKDDIVLVLPKGAEVVITEVPNASYTTTWKLDDAAPKSVSKTGATDTITMDKDKKHVTFYNISLMGTAAIDFSKYLDGRAYMKDDNFTFMITAEEGTPMPVKFNTETGAFEPETVTADAKITDAVGKVRTDATFKTFRYTLADLDAVEVTYKDATDLQKHAVAVWSEYVTRNVMVPEKWTYNGVDYATEAAAKAAVDKATPEGETPDYSTITHTAATEAKTAEKWVYNNVEYATEAEAKAAADTAGDSNPDIEHIAAKNITETVPTENAKGIVYEKTFTYTLEENPRDAAAGDGTAVTNDSRRPQVKLYVLADPNATNAAGEVTGAMYISAADKDGKFVTNADGADATLTYKEVSEGTWNFVDNNGNEKGFVPMVKAEAVQFTNVYDSEAEWTPDIVKVLNGRPLERDQFKFTMKAESARDEDDQNETVKQVKEYTDKDFPVPGNGSAESVDATRQDVEQDASAANKGTNDLYGPVIFNPTMFTNDDLKKTVTYGNAKVAQKNKVICWESADGKTVYGPIPGDATAKVTVDGKEATVTFDAATDAQRKAAQGTTSASKWTYKGKTYIATSITSTGTGAAASTKVGYYKYSDDGTTKVFTEVPDGAKGTYYMSKRTFIYKLWETGNGVTESVPGYAFDAAKNEGAAKTVEVTVEEQNDGTLKVTAKQNNKEITKTEPVIFTNTYTAKGDLIITAKKVIEGRKLSKDEFSFSLTGPGITGTATAQNDESGNITFPKISLTQADFMSGTAYDAVRNKDGFYEKDFTYTLKETSTDANGVTVDGSTITCVVTLREDKKGNITVVAVNGNPAADANFGTSFRVTSPTGTSTTSAASEVVAGTFTNAYQASGTAAIKATKKLEGKTLEANMFYFVLTDAKGNVIDEKGNGAGDTDNIKFTTIAYNLDKVRADRAAGICTSADTSISATDPDNGPWTYTYKIKELVPTGDAKADGIEYDTHEETVTVVLTDDGKGKLNAAVTYDADGAVFTNQAHTVAVTAKKDWNDAALMNDGKPMKGYDRPKTVSFQLKANGSAVGAPVAVSKSSKVGTDEWAYTWTDLPKFTYSGSSQTPITYTVEELEVPYGYEVKVLPESQKTDNFTNGKATFTVTNTPDVSEILGADLVIRKLDQTSKQPLAGATFALKNTNDEKVKEVTTDAAGYAPIKFGGTDGVELTGNGPWTFTLTETGVPAGYATPDPESYTITVSKDGASVAVQLHQTDRNIFQKFYDLVFNAGSSANYISATKTLTVANTRKTYAATVTKTFTGLDAGVDPATYFSNFRIDATYFNQDNQKKEKELKLTDTSNLTVSQDKKTYTWTIPGVLFGTQVTAEEKNYTANGYMLKSTNAAVTGAATSATHTETHKEYAEFTMPALAENAKATIAFTNTYEKMTGDLNLEKIWDDANDQDGLRVKDKVTLRVTADSAVTGWTQDASAPGTYYKDVEISKTEGNTWKGSLTKLPVCKANSTDKITYTVTEPTVPAGYTTTSAPAAGVRLDPANAATLAVTNKHVPKTVQIEVKKVWNDADNKDGLRANTKARLYKTVDGKETTAGVADATVNKGADTATRVDVFTWTGLPAYESGKAITYTVKEDAIPGYTSAMATSYTKTDDSTYSGTDGSVVAKDIKPGAENAEGKAVVTITNTHVTSVTLKNQIEVVKELSGRAWQEDDEFAIALIPVNDKTPMPDDAVTHVGLTHSDVVITDETTDYKDHFGPITYTIDDMVDATTGAPVTEKTFTYHTRELTAGESGEPRIAGITYSTARYEVDVTVEVSDGALRIKSVKFYKTNGATRGDATNEMKFVNTYNAEETVYKVTADKSLTSYGGDSPLEDEDFQFMLKPVGANAATAPMPKNTTGTGAGRSYTVYNYGNSVRFEDTSDPTDGLKFNYTDLLEDDFTEAQLRAGVEFEYEISEVIPAAAENRGDGYWVEEIKEGGVVVDEVRYDGIVHYRKITVKLDDSTGTPLLTVTGSGDDHQTEYYLDKSGNRKTLSPEEVTAHHNAGGAPLFHNYHIALTNIEGTKVWHDEGDPSKRPASIKVRLERYPTFDGAGQIVNEWGPALDSLVQPIAPITVTGNTDSWSFEFTELPEYVRETGQLIEYRVVEDGNSVPEDYVSFGGTADDKYVITNVLKTSIPATKVWDDASDQDGKRPSEVTFQLYQKVGEGEETIVDGKTVTLKATDAKTTEVDDGEGGTTTETDTDIWTKANAFGDLPKYTDAGAEITYILKEVRSEELISAGYETSGNGTAKNQYTITNTRAPETRSVTLRKIWIDKDADGTSLIDREKASRARPSSVKLLVTATTPAASGTGTEPAPIFEDSRGNPVNTKEVELTATNVEVREEVSVWMDNTTLQSVPKYYNGKEISYNVTESDVPVNYTATALPIGHIVVNTYNVTSITGTKVWDDGVKKHDNTTEVELMLHRNWAVTEDGQEKIKTETVTGAHLHWEGNTYTYTGLPGTAPNGKPYTYWVSETQAAHYQVPAYSKEVMTDAQGIGIGAKDGGTITNVYSDSDGSATVNAVKHLSGRAWKSGDAFNFELSKRGRAMSYGADGNYEVATSAEAIEKTPLQKSKTSDEGGEPAKTDGKIVKDAGGTERLATFPEIEIEWEDLILNPKTGKYQGDFEYTMKEIIPADAIATIDGNEVTYAEATAAGSSYTAEQIRKASWIRNKITYDTTEHLVHVRAVSDGTDALDVRVFYNISNSGQGFTPVFANTYDIGDVSATLDTTDLEDEPLFKKTVKAFPAGASEQTFAFTLSAKNGAPGAEKPTARVTVKKDANGAPTVETIDFGKITFTLDDMRGENGSILPSKDFTYTITEQKEAGWKANDYTAGKEVTVTVTYNAETETLSIGECEPAKVTITNEYDPNEQTSVPTANEPGQDKIVVKKELTGGKLARGMFKFDLESKDDPSLGSWTATNDENGLVMFPAVGFRATGTYRFELSEADEGADRITYDDTKHTVICVVSDENADGRFEFKWTARDGDKETDQVTFRNSKAAIPTLDVTAEKVWAGDTVDNKKNYYKLRTDVILHLYGMDENGLIQYDAGTKKIEMDENGEPESSVTWKDLPEYIETGKPLSWEITEEAVAGYTSLVEVGYEDGGEKWAETVPEGKEWNRKFRVTNTFSDPVTEVSVTKEWQDDNDRDSRRPDSVIYELWKKVGTEDAKKIDTKEVPLSTEEGHEGEADYTWQNLPATEHTQSGTETVSRTEYQDVERQVQNDAGEYAYRRLTDPDPAGGTPQKDEVIYVAETEKETYDADTANYEPVKETVQEPVSVDEEVSTEKEVPVIYYVKEVYTSGDSANPSVLERYYKEPVVEAVGPGEFRVINARKAYDTTEITVTKTWDDGDNADGVRPEYIRIKLKADGEIVRTDTLTAKDASGDNAWKKSYKDLPLNAKKGTTVVYTVEEDAVSGYDEPKYSGKDGTLNIINSHKPAGKKTLVVTKVWQDAEGKELEEAPADATFHLMKTVEGYGAVKVEGQDKKIDKGASGEQLVLTWADLPAKENGKSIEYSVEEEALAGYTTSYGNGVKDGDTTRITVTNKAEPGPEMITIRYVDENGVVKEKTITRGENEPDPPETDPTKEGYYFGGWKRTVDEYGNVTYTATWIKKEEEKPEDLPKVTYVDYTQAGDGIVILQARKYPTQAEADAAAKDKTDAPTAGEKEGYTFVDWYAAQDSFGDWILVAKYNEKDKDPQTKTVTFIDGKTGTIIKTATMTDGKEVEKPAAPSYPNMAFVKWVEVEDESGNKFYIATYEADCKNSASGKTSGNASERTTGGTTSRAASGRNATTITGWGKSAPPNTGDPSQILLYLGSIGSAVTVAATAVAKRRRDRRRR